MGRIVEDRILNSKLTDIELLGPPWNFLAVALVGPAAGKLLGRASLYPS